MRSPLRVLMVEDVPDDARLLARVLEKSGRPIEYERVEDAAGLREAVQRTTWDVVLCDWTLPRFGAVPALNLLKELGFDLPFIVVSGTIGEESAVEVMRAGAHDFVLKERSSRLLPAVERELRESQERAARRKADLAVRESELRYRRIVETTTEGVCLLDPELKITFANGRLAMLLGYSVEELVGRYAGDVINLDQATLPARLAQRRQGISGEYETEFRRRDGQPLYTRMSVTPVFSATGVFEGILGMMSDISAWRRAEDARRQSEARLQRLNESGILGIVVVDLEGLAHEANDALLSLLGYTQEDLHAGRVDWTAATPVEWKEAEAKALAQLRAQGTARPWEKELLHRDGRRVPVLVGVAMLEAPRFIAFIADLTERKKVEGALRSAEAQLWQIQKMDAVGSLAGGIAHDFNNLLSVILSYTSLMLSDLPEASPLRADLGEVQAAGQRAAALTRQLLLFSRQEVMEPRIVDLNEHLAGMEKMLRRIVGDDIELTLRTGPPAGRVRANPSHLEQVVMNLVVNARDAMPKGGRLTLETGEVDLDDAYVASHVGARPGPHAALMVSDTGVGMSQGTQARIFEPFFTTKEKGTGLGLSTVFGIVRQSGGSIWVYSEPGHGTTFKVYLPRVDVEAEVRPAPTPARRGGGTEVILLVDDNTVLRMVARDILKRWGYLVIDAGNADEALVAAERHPGKIDLLVTDVVMPQVSGPELARRLLQVRPGVKVLCVSGYADDAVVRHGGTDPSFAFLQKPITPDTLSQKVRAVLDGT